MKWYWIVLIAVLAIFIGFMLGRAKGGAKIISMNPVKKDVEIKTETNPATGEKRIVAKQVA